MRIEVKFIDEAVCAAVADHYSPSDLVESGGCTYLVVGPRRCGDPNVFVLLTNADCCGSISLLSSDFALTSPKLTGRLIVTE